MKDLRNKRVLLVAPRFFGYEKQICEEIQSRGAEVLWLPDRPLDSPFQVGITRFAHYLLQSTVDNFYLNWIEKNSTKSFDYLLVINGQSLSSKFFREFTRNFPNTTRILYMWDSMENKPLVKRNLDYFDEVSVFDKETARNYGMRFRPLFYSKRFEFGEITKKFQYDFSFIGTMHSDRYRVIKELCANFPVNKSGFFYFYLQSEWVYWIYKLIKPSMLHSEFEEFSFNPLDGNIVSNIFRNSFSIIDIEHPNQTGLTMRTLETLGASKKLITTNKTISEYDFYNSNNIHIVERNNPRVPNAFWESDYEELSPEIYRKYSIAGWLDDVMGIKRC